MSTESARMLDLHDLALEKDPVAQLIVDASGVLLFANEAARMLFSLNSLDLHRPLQELHIAYRPVDLRALAEQAQREQRSVAVKETEWSIAETRRYFDLTALPLVDGAARVHGVKLLFNDVTRAKRLQDDLQQSRMELETANEELHSTNEELETTNEELQSTVEELETTNEELQSSNEELETMNEELQSTNEELEASNEQLRERSDQVAQLNVFLESILGSLSDAVIVLDRELQVQLWNQRAEDLWGLRAHEVRQRHLLSLDIGLPLEQLRQPVRACLSDGSRPQTLTLDATNRRGKPVRVMITCSPLSMLDRKQGVILLMSEQRD